MMEMTAQPAGRDTPMESARETSSVTAQRPAKMGNYVWQGCEIRMQANWFACRQDEQAGLRSRRFRHEHEGLLAGMRMEGSTVI